MAIVLDGEDAKLRAELTQVDAEIAALDADFKVIMGKQDKLHARASEIRRTLEKNVRIALYGERHGLRSD